MRYIISVILICPTLALLVLAGSVSGVSVRSSSPTELLIEYQPVVGRQEREWLHLPLVTGAQILGRSEEDWLQPVVEFPITVPGPQAIGGIEVTRVTTRRQSGLPATVREFVERTGSAPPIGRVPEQWAEVVYGGIARARHLAYVRIRCALPHPSAGVTEILESLELRICFLPERAVPPPLWDKERQWETRLTLNDEVALQWYAGGSAESYSSVSQTAAVIPPGTWLRLGIREEGIYRITAEQLQQLGVRLSPAEVATLKLWGTGGEPLPEDPATAVGEHVTEIPIIVRTEDNGELREILFYGAPALGFHYRDSAFQHFLNPYSELNYYLLTWGGTPGLRVSPAPPPFADSVFRPSTYTARIFYEQELYQPFALGSGRDWFGPLVDPALPVVYTTPLPDLDRSGEILYRFVLVNRASVPAQYEVTEGGRLIWRGNVGSVSPFGYVEAVSSRRISVRVPADSIAPDNRSVLRFSYRTSTGTGSGHVDWVEIHYPRRFVAVNNTIEFFTDPSWSGVLEIAVTGFSGKEIWGFDVTDRRRPLLLQNLARSSGVFVFRTEQQRSQPRRFFISARFLSPVVIERAEVLGLRQQRQGVSLIVVTHRQLLNSATAYQRYRSTAGISSFVVPMDAVYNEFAAGMPDPTALRNFLATALVLWDPPPRFVIFWGDGHYDYKGISTQRPSYVPTYQSATLLSDVSETSYNAINSYTTDDYFTWLQGNDPLPDIGLGRIPINSDAEGMWMVEKLRQYEHYSAQGNWRTTITLVADDGPTTGASSDCTLHTQQSEELSRLLPPFLLQRKIYLTEYPAENIPGGRRKPGVTQDLVAAVNAGTLLLNWIGHGNPRLWAHEQILERETTVPLFRNLDRLFFLTAATCDFARFDDPHVPSGAEVMLLSQLGGAIGVVAASRLVYATPNARIMQYFYSQLFQRRGDSTFAPLGEVYMAAKLQRFDTLNDRKYVLLGDPVLSLLLPNGRVQMDSLNGIALTDSIPTIAPWGKVRLSGRVLTPRGEEWTDFSGNLFLTLTDAPIQFHVPEPCGSGVAYHVFEKLSGILHQGMYTVQNGRWTVEFVVPQELSFSEIPGRLFAVAVASDGRSASGVYSSIHFAGTVPSERQDTVGPRIRLYIDDPSFRPGDLVRSVPELIAELWDESGVNTSGALGRRIEVWVDDETASTDLTPLFQLLPDRPGIGIVRKPLLGLDPGLHRVRLRAWDVYGNFSIAETFFRIAPEPILAEPTAIPNPAAAFPVRFSFLFTGTEPMRAEFVIATVVGSLLYRREVELLPQRRVELMWDGTTGAGVPVVSGTYVYSIRLLTPNSPRVAGTIVVVR